jgi:hypothetical protein
MNIELTPEQRKQRLEMILKIVGVGVVGFLVAPFVLTAIGGILGLIVAAGVTFVAINMVSWFSLKVANWRLKALKHEAMKNPVETLQTKYIEKETALKSFKENIRIFAGQVLTFGDQVKQYVKDGLEDAQTYVEQLGKMKQLLDLRQQKYREAQEALAQFSKTIEQTDRKWKMACAAMAMNEAAGQMEGDAFDKICIETALDSVQTKLNQSFADLEVALLDSDKEKAKRSEYVNRSSMVTPTTETESKTSRQKIATT